MHQPGEGLLHRPSLDQAPFYLTERFGLDEQAAITTVLICNLASMVAMALSGPLGGVLSDKIGKRRPVVAFAGVIMVIGLVVLAVALSVSVVIPTTPPKTGVLTIANALPQSIAPAIAPGIIALGAGAAIGGYATFYLFGAAVALAGAVLVFRIKGVQ